MSRARATRVRIDAFDSRRIRSGNATLSDTVMCGNSA